MIILDVLSSVKLVKLQDSYNLSYGVLDAYESVIVTIKLDNNLELLGEVTPLAGYTDETLNDVLKELEEAKALIVGMSIEPALKKLYEKVNKFNSFALSAIIPPLEDYYDRRGRLPVKNLLSNNNLVYALKSEQEHHVVKDEIMSLIEADYDTVKIKVGKSLNRELALINFLSKIDLGNIKIRFDANGGYSFGEAKIILNALSKINNNVEYLEQPLCRECWDGMEKLIKEENITPIMIDESIYTLSDIRRSHDIGAKFIKIKLCKYGSLYHLQQALDYANSLGLLVVFGNGVATDIANYYEMNFYLRNKDKIYGATEGVGFLKIKNYLAFNLRERVSGA
jgi:L-Ala-D/L-Glu epimerase